MQPLWEGGYCTHLESLGGLLSTAYMGVGEVQSDGRNDGLSLEQRAAQCKERETRASSGSPPAVTSLCVDVCPVSLYLSLCLVSQDTSLHL